MSSYLTRSSPALGGARPIGSSNRGFASVDPERQREGANPGSKAANESSNSNADSASGDGAVSCHGNDDGSVRDKASGKR